MVDRPNARVGHGNFFNEIDSLLADRPGALPPPTPPKMFIERFGTSDPSDRVVAMFNPSEFEESIAPKWARLAPQGNSYEIRHYVSTGPYSIKLSLFWIARNEEEVWSMHRDRRRLLNWANPSKVGNTLAGGGGPATLMLIWPGMVAVQCDLIAVKFKHQRFNTSARSTVFTAECEFEEQRGTFLTDDDSSGRFGMGEPPPV